MRLDELAPVRDLRVLDLEPAARECEHGSVNSARCVLRAPSPPWCQNTGSRADLRWRPCRRVRLDSGGAYGVGGEGAAAASPTLLASVGPDSSFKITLTDAKGRKFTSLKAGIYRIKVSDTTGIHNFHLTGPGLDRDSGVAAKGASTWQVVLKKGTYKYVCDPHASIMKGSFTVS